MNNVTGNANTERVSLLEHINLEDYVSGGYFLVRSGRPPWTNGWGELWPPGDLISLSRCLCPERLAVYWGWIPGDRHAALQFGIPESKWDDFKAWCEIAHQTLIDHPSMFHSPEAARSFVRTFDIDTTDLFLIGAALPRYLLPEWSSESPEKEDYGITKSIQCDSPIDPSGKPLGYEVVSFAYNDFEHSWLCHAVDREMNEVYGFRPGPFGLIQSYADAKTVYDWMSEDVNRGEPDTTYDFWLYLVYSLD